MQPLELMYPESFFRHRNSLLWRSEIFCKPVLDILKPKSVIDVGCAIGDFVKWFLDHDIDAWGIEGSTAARKYSMIPERISYMDMRKKYPRISYPLFFDLAMSIEVAEHIEPEYARCYAENMTVFSDTLLMTIAGPGQKGHSHVNLQPMNYWETLFAKHNYSRDIETEFQIKERLYEHRHNRWINAICNNLCIFRNDTTKHPGRHHHDGSEAA